jgi:hypothetical protein
MLREMATTVAFKDRQPILVSPSALKRAGFKSGQKLEVRVSGGAITILPKSGSLGSSETEAERRAINARLADGLADIDAGRTFGPFDTIAQMVAHMKRQVKTTKSKKAKRLPAK